MTKKTELVATDAKIYPQTEALLLSAEYDNLKFTDMQVKVNMDVAELTKTCSMLASTVHADYFIGSTFISSPLSITPVIELEISIVKQTQTMQGIGRHRVPLNSVATQYAVLQCYVTAGLCAMKFMQDEITWAEYKRALTELLPGDIA